MILSEIFYLENKYPTSLKDYDFFRGKKASVFRRKSFEKLNHLISILDRDCFLELRIENDLINFHGNLPPEMKDNLELFLKELIPWRKGPWRYGPINIDSEWKSGMKWDRINEGLPKLSGKRICDIGCNNLYYSYRMLESEPEFVFGIDPYEKYFYHYMLNQMLCRQDNLFFDFLGVDDMGMFSSHFDIVFCMGILYHRRDPIGMLKTIGESLVSGGVLILESLCLPDERSVCLVPENRFLKAPGYWFIPSPSAIISMLKRTGYCNIEIISLCGMSSDEQRRTEWSIYESWNDFIDPADAGKTIEGYPVPKRVALRAEKK